MGTGRAESCLLVAFRHKLGSGILHVDPVFEKGLNVWALHNRKYANLTMKQLSKKIAQDNLTWRRLAKAFA